MSRYIAPAAFTLAVLGVGLTLILVVTLRPWSSANSGYDTHLNFRDGVPDDYVRTDAAWVDDEAKSLGWEPSGSAAIGDNDKALFVGAGCAGCHGLQGTGGIVGPNILAQTDEDFTERVRFGPYGMPAADTTALPDGHVAMLIDYLRQIEIAHPEAVPTPTPTPQPTPTPRPTPTPPPAPEATAGAISTSTAASPTESSASSTGGESFELGKRLYDETAGEVGCAYCHGMDGRGGEGGPGGSAPSITGMTRSDVRQSISGVIEMDDIKLTKAEILAVVEYLRYLNEQP